MALAATSGTYGWTASVYKLICSALRLCGAIGDEELPTAAQAQNALDAMNAMVKGWQVSQIHVWCEEECILFPQPNQNQYRFGVTSTDNACLFTDLLQTKLTAQGASGAGSVTLASVASIQAGSHVGVQLDSGVNFWTTASGAPTGNVVPLTSPLPSSATSGAIGFSYVTPLVRPLRAPEGRRYLYSSQIETPLIVLSRFDYDYLPNKFNTGTVTQMFYDPQTGSGSYSTPTSLMNLWPAPSDNTAGIRFVGQRPIQDFITLANIPDFPVEWTAALKWNLAVESAPEFDVPADRYDRLKAKADEWFLRASSWDREPEPILFGMAMQPGYR